MAKNKKAKKKNLSEKKLKPAPKKSVNPFEIHLNKQKHRILGQKCKNDKGLPGVTRTKGIKKRKETLLNEVRMRNKANAFIDKRIGEKDSSLNTEEKMLARFSSEKKKQMKNIYNLNDEEELTHYGQSLSEIEKFEDPRSDSEDDENQLGANFVDDANFGGFLKKKYEDGHSKSRAEIIEEMIANSKKKKFEKRADREAAISLTDKLNADWKEIHSMIAPLKRDPDEKNQSKGDADDFDILVRQLKFESRGTPTNKLKTSEEVAAEEKNWLAKQEAERVSRMKGLLHDEDNSLKHKSADDLDDGFALDNDESDFQISYNQEGQLLINNEAASLTVGDRRQRDNSVAKNGNVSETDDGGESGEDSDEADNSVNDDSEDEDNHSDLESDGDEENETNEKFIINKAKGNSIKEDLMKRKEMMEAARKELPYTFEVPGSCDELASLLNNYSCDQQVTVIERMIKCNHPSLNESNKVKLESLFINLLQHLHNRIIEENSTRSLKLADVMKTALYDLNLFSPVANAKAFLSILQDKHQEFEKLSKRLGSGNVPFPHFSCLYLLQLLPLLYPASDLRHVIITPALIFLSRIMTCCKIQTIRDIFIGFYICKLCHLYVKQSKRYIPEVLSLIQKGLSFALSEKSRKALEAKSSYKMKSNPSVLLVGPEDKINDSPSKLPLSTLFNLTADEESADIKTLVTKIGLNTVKTYMDCYSEHLSFANIFSPILQICKRLKAVHPSSHIQILCDEILNFKKGVKLAPLAWERRRPPSIKFLEPKIVENYDGRKRKKGNKTDVENQKLLTKYKKEMKGAMREIRKDNQFLANEDLEEQLKRDAERKRKVKKLYSDLANQEGDYKEMKRKKNSSV